MPKSFYLPPRRKCEAAVNLLAASPWMRGGGLLTCCSTAWMQQSTYLPTWLEITEGRSGPTCCFAVNARRRPPYLLLYCLDAAVYLPAALSRMRGGCRSTCDIEDQRTLSTYLLPRRGCEAAVAQPTTLKPGGRSGLIYRPGVYWKRLSSTCRLSMDARRRSPYLSS